MLSKFRIFNNAHILYPATIYLQEASGSLDKHTILSPFVCIQNLAYNCYHCVVLDHQLSFLIKDEYGNQTNPIPIESGRLYKIKLQKGKWEFQRSTKIGATSFEIMNVSKNGAPDIVFLRGGYVIGTRRALIPGDISSGKLNHAFQIRYFSCEPIPERSLSLMNDEYSNRISYLHVMEADVVMTGGGFGSNALPCSFHLENSQPWKS